MKMAGKFPAARWTRVFRPAQNQPPLIYYMIIISELCRNVNYHPLFDIHGGAFETAVMNYFYPEFVDLQLARTLELSSLTMSGLQKWLEGGETTKAIVPLGYAGNPAGCDAVGKHVKDMIALQVSDIARRIMRI